MSEQFSLCVVFRIKPEHAEEFASLVEENVAETRKDKGVVIFNYHKVVGEPTWVLYEIWESKQDSDDHRQKPDVQAFFARAPQLLADEPTIYALGPVL
ncbi:putative quinol monooxygenase [Xanthomonas hortorum]|uniref:Antibiotic biosynthesis monooxygenase n=1 Tax=Xanthomonas hortorum pv. hederae TaxID=453603 RepID=A0A9X4BUH5_9XANT|nr:putative quinol monooxygenase [Xanthomonas hortorum]MCE4372381.1 antibiotic biosynthesis monooxygenase [Xanthomonas hortorum pv. hederae]MDC8639844.1 antibiotic biosynthesis monooxygenase [Xanthomonas hortorum pv. hederae]